jgi:anthranilate synthase component 1
MVVRNGNQLGWHRGGLTSRPYGREVIFWGKGVKFTVYHPTPEEFKALGKRENLVPVYREVAAGEETPVSAYLKVKRGGYSFLLESVEGGKQVARYSFIGTEPYRVLSTREGDKTDPLNLIAEEMNQHRLVAAGGLPDFCGGAVGYLAYETIRRLEELPSPDSDPLNLPESVFMFADTLLIFDHANNKIKIVSHARPDGATESAYKTAIHKIDDLANRLEQPLKHSQPPKSNTPTQPAQISSNLTREEFEANVEKARQYITEGEAIQIVLSQRLSRRTSAPPFEIYRALRDINPSPYMFFLDLKDFQLIGSSPEILVRAVNGTATTRPLAGTRPRGKTKLEDARLEKELRNDEKERAEHIMLVDLGRNDIGRVSLPGTVKVSELMDVERYSHVMHLVTNVEGRLRPELTPFDALRACFPAGTVSGAPKIRAMEAIAELEPDKRGPYAGCVGYFSFSGGMDTAITIRTIITTNGTAHVQAGAGIVYDSVPAREYKETLSKARALLKAIEEAETTEMSHAAAD